MAFTSLQCPSCGAPVTNQAAQTCGYCGAVMVSQTPVASEWDVTLWGLTSVHVPTLIAILGRPPGLMARVPERQPPTVFAVNNEQLATLKQRLGPMGVRVEERAAEAHGPPRGRMGPPGRRR